MSPEAHNPKKKTRRRLRVSCVECTRRRQKCDRAQPCGLCKSRGVEHLCRWELEPFARPAPSRPAPAQNSEAKSPVQKQTQTGSEQPEESSSIPPGRFDVPELELNSTIEHEVKEAAIALAQLSIARHGEFLGSSSLVCALHRLNDLSGPKIPIDKSSGLPFSARSQYSSAVSSTFASSLQSLISNFPDKFRCDTLITSFFTHENWRYGLPQALVFSVYNVMWETIQTDRTSVERINFHWVTFLFAMFALSPGCASEEESRTYFLQALTGKRLAEDVQSASFFTPRDPGTFSQGTAHGCIAASLMSKYMCDRGQMTEAWKLVGSAVRSAQNAGLNLNPAWTKWKDMTGDEQALWSLAWHMCTIKDRFLSLALGRPAMVRSREYHVPLLKETYPPSLAADGSTNTTIVYQACLSRLLENVSEEKDKYLSIHPDPSDGGERFDARMSAWEASLPTYLTCREPDTTLDHVYPRLQLQRCLIACYYYVCLMIFHRSLSCDQVVSESLNETRYSQHQWDFDKLTGHAIDLLHAQKAFLAIMKWQRQICFTVTYFIFEAAITLSIAIYRDADNPDVDEWRRERGAAIDLLQSVLDKDNGELTQQAIIILRVLQDKGPTACGTDSTIAFDAGELSMADLSSTSNASSSAWPLFEPQSAAATSIFHMDAFQSLEFSLGDQSSTFAAFDLLFNLDQSQ